MVVFDVWGAVWKFGENPSFGWGSDWVGFCGCDGAFVGDLEDDVWRMENAKRKNLGVVLGIFGNGSFEFWMGSGFEWMGFWSWSTPGEAFGVLGIVANFGDVEFERKGEGRDFEMGDLGNSFGTWFDGIFATLGDA